jgi:hypothetical protein
MVNHLPEAGVKQFGGDIRWGQSLRQIHGLKDARAAGEKTSHFSFGSPQKPTHDRLLGGTPGIHEKSVRDFFHKALPHPGKEAPLPPPEFEAGQTLER